MEWISSAGGPLVLLPNDALALWRGVFGGDDGAAQTEYERACSVDDYLGLIGFNGSFALVLGDEPHQTAIWEERGVPMLVRWMYASGEDAVMAALRTGALNAPVETLDWQVSTSAHTLLDAASSGSAAAVTLCVSLEPGRYRVKTHLLTPSPDVGLVVHVFEARDVPGMGEL